MNAATMKDLGKPNANTVMRRVIMKLPNFQNEAWLRQALTHSTYVNEHPNEGPDNERLEFLGDSILEFGVRDLMFSRYPTMTEGNMSKLIDRLVDESCLASLAVQLGIPELLRLGSGSQYERDNPGVQADAFEAIIGAYRLDSDIQSAYDYVTRIFKPLVEQALELPPTDPVSALQEVVQASSKQLPEYRVVSATGPDHAKTFEIAVYIEGQHYGTGCGSSKKEARKNAAMAALLKVDSQQTNTVESLLE
jgi:ribonuclease III